MLVHSEEVTLEVFLVFIRQFRGIHKERNSARGNLLPFRLDMKGPGGLVPQFMVLFHELFAEGVPHV